MGMMRTSRWGRVCLGLVFCLGLTGLARAEDGPKVQEVRLGFGREPMFRRGTWTPVWVDVVGGRAPSVSTLELSAPDDDGVPVRQRYRVHLNPGQRKTVAGSVRPGLPDAEVRARLLDKDGLATGRATVLRPKQTLDPSTLLVLTEGKVSGAKLLPSVAKFREAGGSSPELAVKPLQGRWPETWYGYDSVEALVLETSDPETLGPLSGKAGEALKTWVRHGGHLVVALGPGPGQAQSVELLGEMLPAKPAGEVRLTDLGALESFAGSGQTATGHPLKPPMTVTKLEDWQERGGVPLASDLATPLVVRGSYGLGKVTLAGIDVAAKPFSGWKDEKFFWDKVLSIPGHAASDSSVSGGRGALIEAGPSDLSARLHRSLETFPGVEPVPFGWVAFFVFLYIILIGPLDYLFLRKVAGRMELTWVTFPLMVAVVSAVAYAGAYAVKGRSLRANKVDALDYDQTTGSVRGSTWLTVFSPQNRDYDVSIQPLGPALDEKQPADPGPHGLVLSWFGSPDPALAGLGRISLGGSGYLYAPEGQLRAVEGVRVPIWSTRGFSARWVAQASGPVLEADITPVGGDRVAGSVRNLLDVPLKNAQLYYGRNVYDLGTVRPRGIARIDPTRTEAMTRYLGRLAGSFDPRKTSGRSAREAAEEALSARAGLVRAAMFHDAMGSRAAQNPSRPLRPLDLSDQVRELHRPMFVAEAQAPAAVLKLDGGKTEADVSQTTVLRVVLSVGETAANP